MSTTGIVSQPLTLTPLELQLLEHSHTWAWDTTPEHLAVRRLLLEQLRAHVNPAEMTVAQILEREA